MFCNLCMAQIPISSEVYTQSHHWDVVTHCLPINKIFTLSVSYGSDELPIFQQSFLFSSGPLCERDRIRKLSHDNKMFFPGEDLSRSGQDRTRTHEGVPLYHPVSMSGADCFQS